MLADTTFEVTSPPFKLALSSWDENFPPLYSRRVLCFKLSEESKLAQIARVLEVAFEATVLQLPFLTGKVVPKFVEDQICSKFTIIPKGSAKLIFRDLTDELSFDQLQQSNFDQSLLEDDKISPIPDFVMYQNEPSDVCLFQANFIEGGLLLMVSIAHTACDGRGITEVLKVFAEHIRQFEQPSDKTSGTIHKTLNTEPYECDRAAIVNGGGAEGDIGRHSGWISGPPAIPDMSAVPPVFLSKTFSISPDKLKELKQVATSTDLSQSGQPQDLLDSQSRISTHDAIMGFVWRNITTARYKSNKVKLADAHAKFNSPIDFRKHLNADSFYYGNAVEMLYVQAGFKEMAECPPDVGVALMATSHRNEITTFTKEKMLDAIAWMDHSKSTDFARPSALDGMGVTSSMTTSYWSFDLHGTDFGETLGHNIKAFRLPAKGVIPGMSIVMPKKPDGTCEVMISEHLGTMKCLLEDEFFRSFVTV